MVQYIWSKLKLKTITGVALNPVENGGGSTKGVVYKRGFYVMLLL